MRKLIGVLVLTFATALCASAFAQSRAQLTGYNGIRFGTSISEAAKILGSSFKYETDARPLLDGHAQAFGKDFQIAYTFDSHTKAMTNVDMSAVISGGNETCIPRWQDVLAALMARYGASPTMTTIISMRTRPYCDRRRSYSNFRTDMQSMHRWKAGARYS
jgi:hypothetical protein